jgi:hypothetical protein
MNNWCGLNKHDASHAKTGESKIDLASVLYMIKRLVTESNATTGGLENDAKIRAKPDKIDKPV